MTKSCEIRQPKHHWRFRTPQTAKKSSGHYDTMLYVVVCMIQVVSYPVMGRKSSRKLLGPWREAPSRIVCVFMIIHSFYEFLSVVAMPTGVVAAVVAMSTDVVTAKRSLNLLASVPSDKGDNSEKDSHNGYVVKTFHLQRFLDNYSAGSE